MASLHSRKTRRIESLEPRHMMSADVGIAIENTVDQPLSISQPASNAVVQARPPLSASAVDDAFENNDTWSQASSLGTLTQSAALVDLVMADATDWYKFQIDQTAGAAASVGIQFQNNLGRRSLRAERFIFSSDQSRHTRDCANRIEARDG